MKKILNFKHWQLFILIVLFAAWTSPSPWREIINSIAGVIFLIWIYSIVTFGQEKIARLGLTVKPLKLFKFNIFLIPVLISIIVLVGGELNKDSDNLVDLFLIVAGVYLVFAILYTMMVAGKTLSILEKKRQIDFSDWVGNFILVLVFFIGVWIIQPKVNRLLGEEQEDRQIP